MSRQQSFTSVLCFGLCLSLLVTGCAPQFQEVRVADVSVNVSSPGTQDINLDIALKVAGERIRGVLPAAYFRGMVFSGKWQDLPRLRGRLGLTFEQVRPGLFKHQVVRSEALIDTVRQTMNLYFTDDTEFYPNVRQATFVGHNSFKEIAALAYKRITELGLEDGDVTLTQMDNSWDVRCGALENFVQRCQFDIADGVIRDTPK